MSDTGGSHVEWLDTLSRPEGHAFLVVRMPAEDVRAALRGEPVLVTFVAAGGDGD